MKKVKGLLMISLILISTLSLAFNIQLAKAETDELLDEREGFGRNTYGGLGGDIYYVTTLADSGPGSLRAAAESSEPLWIVFNVSGTIHLNSMLQVKSDKTIDGRSANVTITGHGFSIEGVSNVIVTHLVFDTADGDNIDGIRIYGSHDVWVHHCDFTNWTDGCVDITEEATDVTVSWCKFYNHNKVMLIGASPDATGDVVIRVTVHHNFFNGTRQRHPRLRFGKVDAYNNYLYNWGIYGMRVTMYGQLLVEANIFEAGANKVAVNTSEPVFDPESGYAKLVNNLLLNGAIPQENEPEQVFDRSTYYTATIETADNTLKDKILAEAGAGTPAMPPHSPEASFAYTPSPPIINQTVTFEASASHPGWNGTAYVPIANYTWDFGDGNCTATSDPTITHKYMVKGLYNVTLNVTDTQGLWDTTSKAVPVYPLTMVGLAVTLPYGASAVYPGWGAYPEEWRQITVNVTVENRGSEDENFTVTIYYGDQPIHDYYGNDTQSVTNLAPENNVTLTFQWDTTGVSPQYTGNIYVKISQPTLGDIEWQGSTATVRRTGDANGDGHCKSADFTLLGMSWWLTTASPYYDWRADFNGDGDVKSADFTILAMHWYTY